MPRYTVADLGDEVGRIVRVCGWLQPAGPAAEPEPAGSGTLADRTGAVRLTMPSDAVPNPGSAVEVVGTVVGTVAAAAGQSLELIVDRLSVAGPAEPDLPVSAASTQAERLDWRHLDLRRPGAQLILRVQTTLEQALRAAWAEEDFIEIHSPKLIPTGPRPQELFDLRYFERTAWLAQSPQFYKQMAMAAGLDRVFEIGPVFRYEPAVSPVHATEFTSVDVELAWIDSEADVMAAAELWLRAAIDAVARRHGDDIAALFGIRVAVPVVPFPRYTLSQAWEIARTAGHDGGGGDSGEGDDLDRDGECLLGRHVADRHGHQFVWVTDYPESARPFFHMRSAEGSSLSRSFDLLWNGIEVASGAQREHRHDRLLDQARSRHVPLDPIHRFLDFFRYGCPPHGGLGFGLSRLLMCLLGLPDIREATLLPRDRERMTP
ncbi:MAG: aspartate--tRNA(Asn) ligase [Pseudonocardiaceae bacterium]|nr:aspartate--tRNA(Asn) ligase [Pseudonocardiaceae bacterium]